MRFEVERGTLSEILAVVVNMLPRRVAYPVLQNVLLDVSGSRLRISGTDLDTYVRKETTLSGTTEDGRALVSGRKLAEICREMAGQTVAFVGKGLSVQAESGGAKMTLAGLDPAEFPEMPKPPDAAPLEFPIATLLELLEMVSFAVLLDDSRPAMTGVNWEVSRTAMKMVATDGRRLGYVCRKGKYPATFNLIVAPKVLSLLPRDQDVVAVRTDPGRVALTTPDTNIIGRPIVGPYPDYERVLPRKEYPHRAVLEREAFTAALRRAAVFAHPVGRQVALEFSKGKLRLLAESPEYGSSEEEISCDYDGEPLRIGFNVGYLLEILRHLVADKIIVELQSPVSAGLLKPLEKRPEQEQTYLLMPIRLE